MKLLRMIGTPRLGEKMLTELTKGSANLAEEWKTWLQMSERKCGRDGLDRGAVLRSLGQAEAWGA